MRLILSFLLATTLLHAEGAPRFRTDADGRYMEAELKKLSGKQKDEVLQWFQLVDGQFPPEGSAHVFPAS